MEKPRIFISHISEEAELASILKGSLERDFLGMIDVFVSSDSSSIQAGSRWLDEVDNALKTAQLEIVLCSKASINRPWINFEAGAGWIKGIPVVPICHSGLRLVDLPIPLSLLQAIQADQEPGLEKLYNLVARTLGSAMPKADFSHVVQEVKTFEDQYVMEAMVKNVQEMDQAEAMEAHAQPEPTGKELSPERMYLDFLKLSKDPEKLKDAVQYFKANPTCQALGPLADLASRDETNLTWGMRDEAIAAIARIEDKAALELLLERAVSEQTPGYQALYVRALQGFVDPSMVEPLATILENATGDVVGRPALELARKLKDPRSAGPVKRHFDLAIKETGSRPYLEFCRGILMELDTIRLHQDIHVSLNLPKSLDFILADINLEMVSAERDPIRSALYLKYLKDTRVLPVEELARLAKEAIAGSDVLVRWAGVDLAMALRPGLMGDELREAFSKERIPFMVGIFAEALSNDWKSEDCSLVAQRLVEFSMMLPNELPRFIGSGTLLAGLLLRGTCTDAVPTLELFADAIKSVSYLEQEEETVRRAIRGLKLQMSPLQSGK